MRASLTSRFIIPGVAALAMAVFPAGAQETDAPPADAQLPGLDELLDVPRSSTPAPPQREMVDRPVEDEISTEPFELAVEGMRDAAQRLGEHNDAGIETQRVQEQVVKRLDMLLSQMRRQQMSRQQQQAREQDTGSQQQQQQQQGQPQPSDARQAAGTESNPDAANRQQVDAQQAGDEPLEERFGDEWGNLPPRLRDALRNVDKERVSELYRDLTERYYRRLAEESE